MLQEPSQILVVGGGLSGLSAAHTLRNAGYEVTVLEGRERLGGRVDTRVAEDGLVYEMGGEWIGKNDHTIRKLCQEFSLSLENHELNTNFLYHDTYYPAGSWEPSEQLRTVLTKFVKKYPTLSPHERYHLQHIDWWHFLMKQGIPPQDEALLDLMRSSDFGESMRFVPAYDVLYDYYVGGDGEVACIDHIRGGNAGLITNLARAVGTHHIRLGTHVTAVAHHAGGVSIQTKDGIEFRGARAIIAAPTLATSAIRFTPNLPHEQAALLQEINYSRIMKTAVRFQTRFWEDDAYEVITDRLPHHIYHATQGQPGAQGIMISYAIGDQAQTLSALTEKERVEEIKETLKLHFPHIPKHAQEEAHYYWGTDPYTGGAYPLFKGNERERARLVLGAPVGRIHFAGEHTAKRYGFMEGAVEAGIRAAREVCLAETV